MRCCLIGPPSAPACGLLIAVLFQNMHTVDSSVQSWEESCQNFSVRSSELFRFHPFSSKPASALSHTAACYRYPYNDPHFIVDRFARGLALFTDSEDEARMERVGYCDNAPSLVLANPGRFHYMLSRDPVTGSFSDYADYFGNRTDLVGNFHGEWTVVTWADPVGKTFKV